MRAHVHMLAGYNAWANHRVYEVVATLSDAAYRTEHKAFLGSIHRTLNHLLLTDRLWLARMRGDLAELVPLDGIAYDDFVELRAVRRSEDERLITFVEGLEDVALGGMIQYCSSKGGQPQWTLAEVLASVFTHQSHHRGQVHHMLGTNGLKPPSLDLPTYLEETQRGVAI
jgi:uncharacterized damage-inducible protein DinB